MSKHKQLRDQDSRNKAAQAKLARRKIERNRPLAIESLERRVVLTQDMWTGLAGTTNWQTAGN